MNIKMATNSQLSTIETKQQAKQTSRRETESYIWRSFGWLSVGRGKGRMRENMKGLRSTNW